MAKFRFRLDSLITLKEEQKRQVISELAKAQNERKLVEDNLVKTNIEKGTVLFRLNKKNNVQVLDFQSDYYYIQALDKTINFIQKKILRMKKVEENIIKDIILLDKSKKMMEKLKEKKKQLFDKEVEKAEQNFLDEISQTSRFRS